MRFSVENSVHRLCLLQHWGQGLSAPEWDLILGADPLNIYYVLDSQPVKIRRLRRRAQHVASWKAEGDVLPPRPGESCRLLSHPHHRWSTWRLFLPPARFLSLAASCYFIFLFKSVRSNNLRNQLLSLSPDSFAFAFISAFTLFECPLESFTDYVVR